MGSASIRGTVRELGPCALLAREQGYQYLRGAPERRPALIVERQDGGADTLTRLQMEQWANRLAHRLAEAGVKQKSFVAINLPNGLEHVVGTLAAYKLGACPMPVSYRMPAAERDQLMALAQPAAVLSDAQDLKGITRAQMRALESYPATPPPDAVPQPHKAIASGGSTGKPKLIVTPSTFAYAPAAHPATVFWGLKAGDRLYSPGPLYHNQAFTLMADHPVHRRQRGAQREVRCGQVSGCNREAPADGPEPGTDHDAALAAQREAEDGGSCQRAQSLASGGAMPGLGQARLDRAHWRGEGERAVGGDRGHRRDRDQRPRVAAEAGQRRQGLCNGNPHPRRRSAGRCRWGRSAKSSRALSGAPANYSYLGAKPIETVDGDFASVGDLGYVDADGYLFLADRRVDQIITGGANVVPAEVEAILTQHPGVRDAAVIGLKDDDLGRRVHALIEPANADAPPALEELDAHLRLHLASYKLPRGYEIVAMLPRDEAGKIRRSKLRDERGG